MMNNYFLTLKVRTTKICLLVLLLFTTAFVVNAQVATYYTFASSSGTYIPITGGTAIATATDHTSSADVSLDQGNYAVTIPFNFNFNGTTYTSCNANGNGYITFGATLPTTTTTTPISTTTAYSGAVAAMARDIWGVYGSTGNRVLGSPTITGVTDFTGIANGKPIRGTGIAAGTTILSFNTIAGTITMSANATAASSGTYIGWPNGEIRVETIGSAPNRVCVIQWSGMADFNTTAPTGISLSWQIRLSEGGGSASNQKIDIMYGPSQNLSTTSRTQQVGLRGAAATDFNNRTATTSWSTTSAGTLNTSSMTRTNTIFPASGLTYTWTPPPVCSPPSPGNTVSAGGTSFCAGSAFTLSLQNNQTGVTGLTYQWQSSPDGLTYSNIIGATSNTYATTMAATTTYMCLVTCNGTTSAFSNPLTISLLPGVSGTYTINASVATGGSNFQTFADAISFMSCGVGGPIVFNVDSASGPYGQVSLGGIGGTSSTNTITFNGNGAAITFNSTVTGERAGIKLNGTDWTTIDNFNITATGTLGTEYGFGVQLLSNADHNTISNCKIILNQTSTSTSNFAGIVINSSSTGITTTGSSLCDSNVVSNNNISGGYAGIAVVGNGSTSFVFGNQILNNTITDCYEYGIYMNGNNGSLVQGNDISRPLRATVTIFRGIGSSGVSYNLRVNANRIHNPFGGASASTSSAYGIYQTTNDAIAANQNIYSNNLIYDFIGGTGTKNGVLNIGSDYSEYYHNTIIMNDTAATCAACNVRGFYLQTAPAAGLVYKNNIVHISQGGTAAKQGIYFEGTTTQLFTSNKNDIYITSTGGTVNDFGFWNAVSYNTQALFSAATGQDVNSVSVDPEYVDAANGNYTPTSAGIDNIGDNVGITTDILGLSRSVTTPDPGAYEFTAAAEYDLGAFELVTPATSGCYSDVQGVVVRIKNYSSPIDFSTNPVTVTCVISGATSATLSATPSGTLATNATLDVPLSGTFDMSANGSYTFTLYTSVGSDVDLSNDTIVRARTRVASNGGTLTASDTALCYTGTSLLTVTGTAGGSIQWQSSNVSATGPWTNVGTGLSTLSTGTITTNHYYRIQVACLADTAYSNVRTVAVNNPTILSSTPDTICGTGSAVLNATANAGSTINWYANSTGGAPIASGSVFNTPSISSSTNYYVSASNGGTNESAGKLSAPTTANTIGSAWGLVFNVVNVPITLKTVDIYAVGATTGVISVQLTNNTGAVLATAGPFNFPTGTTANPSVVTLPVNFSIPVGTGYRILSASASGGALIRETSGISYPYTSPSGNVTVTSGYISGTTASTYYFFYNWQVSTGCESGRTLVNATVNPGPTISASASSSLICNGSPVSLYATSTNPDFTYTWTPSNLVGDSVVVNPTSTTTYTVNAIDTSGGAFNECLATANVTVTTLPSSISISSTSICDTAGTSVLALSSMLPVGSTIQWQDSPDDTTYTNISGAIASTYTTPVLSSYRYYKAVIKDGTGNICLTPTKLVTTGVPSIDSVAGATRCGYGSVTLNAYSSFGSTINWYANETGGLPIATGESFTTPNISTTTSFFAGAETGYSPAFNGTVGAGALTSATYPNPFYSLWSNTHNQYLIKASELIAAGIQPGLINSVGLNITAAGTLPMLQFSLKIGETNASSLSTYVSDPLQTVYTSASLLPTTGVNTLTFNTPFTWDGVRNIVLEFCHGNPSSTSTMSRTAQVDSTTYISTIHTHKTTATGGNSQCSDNTTNVATYSVRPKFIFSNSAICSSPRLPVEAEILPSPEIIIVTTANSLCTGDSTSIEIISANGDYSYSWYSVPAGFVQTGNGPFTVVPAVNTTYYAYALDTTGGAFDGCAALTSVNITTGPLEAGSISASNTSICVSGSPTLTATGASGNLDWQYSTVSANGPWTGTGISTATYVPSAPLTVTTYFRIYANCSSSSDSSNVVTITVTTPVLVGTTPGSRCGTGSVALGATADPGQTVNWYANATGGLPLSTGSVFNTPSISTTTNYYAAATTGGVSLNTAYPASTSGTSGSGTTNFGVVFNVTSSFVLNSVVVYPVSASANTAGTVTIDLIDGSGTVLQTATVNVTGNPTGSVVPQTVNLNFTIVPGTNYKLRPGARSSSITGLLFEPSASAPGGNYGYPFTVPGVLSITSSTLTAAPTNTARLDLYYYFYNWSISTGCEGPRQLVTATVTPAPAITVVSADPALCTGGSTTVSVSSPNDPNYSYIWSSVPAGFTAGGNGPFTVSPTINTTYIVSATDTTAGANAGCVITGSTTIFTDTILEAGTLSSSQTLVYCNSGSPTLTVTGYAGGVISYQYSTVGNSGPWTNIGPSTSTYIPTVNTDTWFRALVSCPGNYDSTNVVFVNVNNPSLLSTTPASHCGPASLVLQATATPGASILWYNDSVTNVPAFTGTSFTTPVISSTKTYYAAAVDGASAPTSTTIGAGATTSTTYPTPFYSLWSNTHNQYLIRASELTNAGINAGDITALAVNLTSAGTLPVIDLSLKLGTTTANDLSAWVSTPLLTVYSTPSLTPTLGLNTMTFNTPFAWDGVSNLVIEVCHGNPSSSATMSRTGSVDNTSYISTRHSHVSAASSASASCSGLTANLTTYSIRPNFTFTYVSQCVGTRTPVTATINPSPDITANSDINTICNGSSAQLSVTSSNADYSYSWTPGSLTGSNVSVSPTSGTTYYVNALDTSGGAFDGCTAIDTVIVNVIPDSISVSSTPSEFCVTGGAVALQLNPSSGYGSGSIQWQRSTDGVVYNNISGATTTSLNDTIAVSTYFQAVIRNSNGDTCNVVSKTIPVNNPQVLSVSDGTRCGVGTVDLSATGSAGSTIIWYSAASGGTLLDSGSTYTTPFLSDTTTYYVSAVTGSGGTQHVGPATMSGTTSVVGTYYVNFTVTSPLLIQSVKSYFNTVGTPFTLNIRNATTSASMFTYSGTTTVNGTTTPQTLPINALLSPGTYQMGWTTDPGTYRQSTGGAYPYTLPGLLSITGNTFNDNNFYYYFYDWVVVTGCESGRVPVVAYVTEAPAISATSTSTSICAGDSVTLSVSSSNVDYIYSWTPGNVAGNSISVTPVSTTNYVVLATDTTSGCTNYDTVIVAVNALPTFNATTSRTEVCGTDTVQLNASVTNTPALTVYGVSPVTYAPVATPGSGVTVLKSLTDSAALTLGNYDDGYWSSIVLPFTFNYFGINYTNISINANGYGVLGSSTVAQFGHGAAIPNTATPNTAIGGVQSDLDLRWAGKLEYFTSGVSPNRRFVISYENVPFFNDSNSSVTPAYSGTTTFQIHLVEGNANPIEIHTSTISGDTLRPKLMGIENATGTLAYTVPGRNNTTSWSLNTPEAWRFANTSYTYLWNPSSGLTNSAIFNPIATINSGDTIEYIVTVTNDATGCDNSDTVNIISTPIPQPQVTPGSGTICTSPDYWVHVIDLGAYSGGYPSGTTINWLGIQNGVDSINATLGGTNFIAEVTTPFGCVATSDTVTINVDVINVNRVTTDATCGNPTGQIVATVSNPFGVGPYRYVWTDGVITLRDVTSANNTDSLENLVAGTYFLTVYDNEGGVVPSLPSCNSGSLSTTVNNANGPDAEIVSSVNITCFGLTNGEATADATGGVQPYSFLWSTTETTPGIINLGAGLYVVTVTDANGCTDTAQVTIVEPSAIEISVNVTNVAVCGDSTGSATAIATGGTPGYLYEYYDENLTSLGAPSTNPTFTGLYADTFFVQVTDTNNCTNFIQFAVTEVCDVTVNLKVYFEGYASSFGSPFLPMSPGLFFQGVSANDAIADTVQVDLRDPFSSATVIETAYALIDTGGNATLTFSSAVNGGTYWLSVMHRSSVETFSASPITLSGSNSYNFTTSDTMSYGPNMKDVFTDGTTWAMYSGDIFSLDTFTEGQDGFIDIFDLLLLDFDLQSGVSGYYRTDLNGDGFVDIFDLLILDPNIQAGISKITPP